MRGSTFGWSVVYAISLSFGAVRNAVAQSDNLAVDRAVFEAVVQETADSIPEVLLVDVRPVRPEADLVSFHAADLEDGNPALAASRSRVLQRLSLSQADAIVERRCLFSRGVTREPPATAEPAAGDSMESVRRECLQRSPFAVLVVSRPQTVESTGADRRVRVRVLRFSTYAYGYWDYVLQCQGNGRWIIVARRQHLNIMS